MTVHWRIRRRWARIMAPLRTLRRRLTGTEELRGVSARHGTPSAHDLFGDDVAERP